MKRLDYKNFTTTDVKTGVTEPMTKHQLVNYIERLRSELEAEKSLRRKALIFAGTATGGAITTVALIYLTP